MKNLIVLADFPPAIGGPPIWYYRICEILISKGYRIFSLGGRGIPPLGVINLNPVSNGTKIIKCIRLLCDTFIEAVSEHKVLNMLIRKHLLSFKDLPHLISFMAIIRRIYKAIPKEKGIVLASHVNINSLFAYLLCKKHGQLKFTIRCHGGGILEFADKRPKLVEFLLAEADHINCVSDYIVKECLKKGAAPEKVQCIVPARYLAPFKNSIVKENTVLFCGYLEPRKDPMTCMRAIRMLKETSNLSPQVKFVFIGHGILMEELKSFCMRNQLEKYISFAGILPQEQVWELMKRSKVLILPSIREPLGAVLAEAMAYRCYCIASNTGGIPEIVTPQRGGLFEPGDYMRLAELIADYFNNEENYTQKISTAYNYVMENYTFEKAAGQLSHIFESIS